MCQTLFWVGMQEWTKGENIMKHILYWKDSDTKQIVKVFDSSVGGMCFWRKSSRTFLDKERRVAISYKVVTEFCGEVMREPKPGENERVILAANILGRGKNQCKHFEGWACHRSRNSKKARATWAKEVRGGGSKRWGMVRGHSEKEFGFLSPNNTTVASSFSAAEVWLCSQ